MNNPPDWDDGAIALAILPARMREGITEYVMRGWPTGGFLRAVICNDLARACMVADTTNITILPSYVSFFYNYTPERCFGSPEKMKDWIEAGGWEGQHPNE